MKRGGVTRRAAKVAFVTGLSTVVAIAIQLVSVPVCMTYWGKERYGAWLTLFASFTLLRTAESGYVTYAGNGINLSYHRDRLALRRTLASAAAGMVVIALLQLLACVVYVLIDRSAGLPLLLLTVSWVLSGGYLSIVHRLMIPAGMMYDAAWWAMGFQICQFLAIMAAAISKLTIFQTCLVFVSVQAVVYLASAVYVRRKLPGFYPWWRDADPAAGIRDLWKSGLLTASSLLQQGAANGMVLLVSLLAGPALVTVLTTVRTVTNMWTTLTSVLTAPLLPEIVRYHANREGGKVAVTQEAHWTLAGTVVNLGILASYPLIGPLYAFWTRNRVALDRSLLCFLLSGVAVASAGALMTLYLTGINHLRAVFVTSALRGIATLGLGVLLYPRLGFVGLGVAVLLSETLVLAVSSVYLRGALEGVGARLPGSAWTPFALGLAALLAFLIPEGLGFSVARYIYPASIAGVSAAGWLGWKRMNPGVKDRLRAAIPPRVRALLPS